MKRRQFVKYTSQLSMAPMILNKLPVSAFATPRMLSLMDCMGINERVLVLVFFDGGNDGLNTLVPINQYGDYINHRPDIGLPDTGTGAFVNLDNTLALADQVGIHPAMNSFKTMYEDGKASVIQGVGYPDSNGSHFKSTDLWLTGGDGTPTYFEIGSGWMGRYLSTVYPNLAGNPTEANPDPLGIQLGDQKPSTGYYDTLGKFQAANLTQQDPGGLFELVQSIGTPPQGFIPPTEHGSEIAYIMAVENSINVYAQRISSTFDAGINHASVSYPNSDLGNQLKTVAKLISGGSMTKIYLVRTGGFDTHSGQVESGNPHLGWHEYLLMDAFASIKAFHDDLAAQSMEQRVLTCTFSEFGRKVVQNGSLGTDHGNLAPMFLFGPAVEPQIHGTNLNISPGQITNGGTVPDTQMQYDYRRVFKTIVQDWLGGSSSVISGTELDPWSLIPNMFNTNFVVDPSCYTDTLITQSTVRAKIFLEGFYDSQFGNMRTDLSEKGDVPLAQPYNTSPFNYAGTEAISELPQDTVDWILVELRDGNDINNVLGRRAAFLRRDGQVMGLNGGLGVAFDDVLPNLYYVAVYHRSHVAVVSSVTVDLLDVTNVYDFTLAETQALGSQQLKSNNGVYLMIAGDFDGDGHSDIADYDNWKLSSSKIGNYETSDGDGNGVVNNADYNLWKSNENHAGHSTIQQN